jgi:hypothetical protein
MLNPTAVARTAPIAIASRKPRSEYSNEFSSSHHTPGGVQLPGSMSSSASGESGTTNVRGRKDRPCDACRKRKSRCVINEGQTTCVLCQFHTQDCTFVQSPQPRKRKLNAEGKEESVAKRRYEFILLAACLFLLHSLLYILFLCCSISHNVLTCFATDPQIELTSENEGQRSRVSQV